MTLKNQGSQGLDTAMLKVFKFFDLNNSAQLSKPDFIKAIHKCGLSFAQPAEQTLIFDHYAINNLFDYKKFVANLL